jgi:hypothetical protein
MIRTCRWRIDSVRLSQSGVDESFEDLLMAERMTGQQLRGLCVELVTDLSLRPPFTPWTLCEELARHRGRPIKLQAADLGATSSVGHLVAEGERDRILYERAAPSLQQATVIYHEVIHLTRDHLDGQTALTCGDSLGDDEHDEGGAVVTTAGGSLYSTWQEWEAEVGSTILMQMSRRRPRPDSLTRAAHPAEHGIAAAFGLRTTDWA